MSLLAMPSMILIFVLVLNPIVLLLNEVPPVAGPSQQPNVWEQTSGPIAPIVQALAVNNTSHLFAGTAGGGVFRLPSRGRRPRWRAINTGLTTLNVEALAVNGAGDLFAGTAGGVFRSTDNGETWTEVNTGDLRRFTTVLTLAVNSSGHLFAGTFGGVLRSTDNGETWMRLNTGLMCRVIFALATNESSDLFAGTDGAGVFRTVEPTGP